MIQFYFNLFLEEIFSRDTLTAFALSAGPSFVSVLPRRMSSSGTDGRPASRPAIRLQEGGLLTVIFLLGLLLTLFGGTVKRPEYKKDATGESGTIMVKQNKFLNAQNLTNLAKDTSFFAIMAVGATFVIVSGGIDLSVGAVYALASVLAALVLHQFGADGPRSSVSSGLSVPLGALKVHPFIITLGTMTIYRGVAFVITTGQSVGTFPTAFPELVKWEAFGGLRLVPLLVMILVTIIGTVYLARFAAGRRIYAVGGNELASRFSGVRVNRVKLSVYVLSGLTAGIAALLAIGYYGSASSGDGSGYELDVIASAVVGGASLSGGKGSALGALLGALIIKMIDNGIVILGIDQSYSRIIIGTVVILAVTLDQFNTWLAKRRLTKTV